MVEYHHCYVDVNAKMIPLRSSSGLAAVPKMRIQRRSKLCFLHQADPVVSMLSSGILEDVDGVTYVGLSRPCDDYVTTMHWSAPVQARYARLG